MQSSTPAPRPKAYTYLRMSTEIQLLGDSKRRQLELSRQYVEDHDLELVEEREMMDIGISAFKGKNFQSGQMGQFLNLVRSDKIEPGSYLILESFDRFSRQDVMKTLGLFLEIMDKEIIVVTLRDNQIYKKDGLNEMMFMYSLIDMSRAHNESKIKSERLSASWANKRNNIDSKKLTARCPGWMNLSSDKKTFIIDESKAKIVKKIFNYSANGIGEYTIVKILNESKVPTFGRSPTWQKSSVAKVINNRAVFGEFQAHRLVQGKLVPTGNPIPDYFPAVIDRSLFDRAHGVRGRKRTGGGGRRGERVSNLFSGIARCGYCGGKMHYISKGAPPKGGNYLVCDNARRGVGCSLHPWRYEKFEASFLHLFEELDLAPFAVSDEEADLRRANEERILELQGQRHHQEQLRSRIFSSFEGGADDPFIADKIREIGGRIGQIEAELAQSQAKRKEWYDEASRFYEGKEQIKALVDRLQSADEKDIYELRASIALKIRSVVWALRLYPGGRIVEDEDAFKAFVENDEDITTEERQRWETALASARNGARARLPYFMVMTKDRRNRIITPTEDNSTKGYEISVGSMEDGRRVIDEQGQVRTIPGLADRERQAKEERSRDAEALIAMFEAMEAAEKEPDAKKRSEWP